MSTPEGGEVVADRYRLASLIGQGGNGAVWRAQDTLLGRAVAVKRIEIPPQLGEAEGARVRRKVLHEARACARLTHPGAVTVFDVVEDTGRPCIVMELVEAPSLAELVQEQGPLSPAQAADLGLHLLDTLRAAHRQGIIHRDIKPGNILVPPIGLPKLADFGIASIVGEPGNTTSGLIPGSPAYMSPEQAGGGNVGTASDLWSLGAALYFAVEGVPPFIKLGALPTMVAIVNDEPRGPRLAGPLTPALMALLTKDPQARPDATSAAELLHEALAASESETGGQEAVALTAPLPPVAVPGRYPPPEGPKPAPPAASGPPLRPPPGPPPVPPPFPRRSPEPFPEPVAPPLGRPPVPKRSPEPVPQPVPKQPPGPVPAPATFKPAPPRGGGPTRQLPIVPVLVGLVCLAALAVLATVLWTQRTGGRAPAQAVPGASSPTTSPTAGASTPSGWVGYTDRATGFVIAHPPAWTVVADGTRTDVRDPSSGTYLRVDHREPPGPSAVGAWQDQEKSFMAQYPGYRRVQLVPTTFDGFPGALWEFTYPVGGALLHAADLGFITGRYGFALYFQTKDADWQRLQPIFENFKRSFRAPKA
jgi:serine/threonine protein kinase